MSQTPIHTGPREATLADKCIGARIRFARVAAGWSQDLLARKTGVTFQQVQKYERGLNRISATRLLEVAHALGRSFDWFLADVASPDPANSNCSSDIAAFLQYASTPDCMELLLHYSKIDDQRTRRRVLALVRAASATPEEPSPTQSAPDSD